MKYNQYSVTYNAVWDAYNKGVPIPDLKKEVPRPHTLMVQKAISDAIFDIIQSENASAQYDQSF